MANVFSNAYTTKRDGGITYYYSAMWKNRGGSIEWEAKIRRAARLVSEPAGTMRNVPAGADISALVKNLIHQRIEAELRSAP